MVIVLSNPIQFDGQLHGLFTKRSPGLIISLETQTETTTTSNTSPSGRIILHVYHNIQVTHKQLTKSRNAATNVDVYPGLVYVYTLSPHSALLTVVVVVVVTVNVTSQLKWF